MQAPLELNMAEEQAQPGPSKEPAQKGQKDLSAFGFFKKPTDQQKAEEKKKEEYNNNQIMIRRKGRGGSRIPG